MLELLVALAVVALFAAIAIPSFADIVQDTRQTTAVNEMVLSLNLARTEAVKRNQIIVVCRGNADDCSQDSGWDDGWIIFADYDESGYRDDDEPLLWVHEGLPTQETLTYHAFPSTLRIKYFPSGRADNNGTFVFCDARGDSAAKALIIGKTGRLRVSRKAADGTPLSCGT